ncbi:hypothetical protein [Yoonia vestfoldensis]|uniref:Uncharacterized protein n=1 Tax=Yoonia vestfoldensis TaxID=245188 RepID=A0A1Y0EHT0_9RHOB|nr:hypothetical protein [Yoonia vestfoldensis]ARU02998.1 hypothetical protein LOKVESSMR4R_03732 [Yoonia vestfoldensis]
MNIVPTSSDAALIAHLMHRPAIAARFRGQVMEMLLAAQPDPAETIIRNAVVGFGGTLIEPARREAECGRISSWGPFDYQLDMLQCSATGATFAELAADWAKAAWRMTPADQVAAE